MLHLRRARSLRHPVHEHARIEVARARAHHHAAGRREGHGGVDAAAGVERGQARAVAQVRHHGPAAEPRAQLGDDELVRESVEAVAPHSFGVERFGDGQAPRALGQVPMEVRVEARDLRHAGEARSHGLDRVERRRQMQRRELDQSPQLVQKPLIEPRR